MVSDRSLAGQILSYASEIYIYKPCTIKDDKKFNIICMKIEEIEWAHNSLLEFIKGMESIDTVVSDSNYFYLLVKQKKLIGFLRELKLQWTKETRKERSLIEFKGSGQES